MSAFTESFEDFVRKIVLHLKRRSVNLMPGNFNQTNSFNSFSLGFDSDINTLSNISRYFPRIKLYVNTSLDLYQGGLGTHLVLNGNPERGHDLILSFGGSFGWGRSDAIRFDMFNQYTPNAITDNSNYAIFYQINRIIRKEGLHQINASIGVRVWRFTLSTSNDVSYFPGTDKNDRYWTGDLQLGYHSPVWGSVTVGTDIYTGQRIPVPFSTKFKTYEQHGRLYYEESESDILLNRGSIYVKVTRKNGNYLMIDWSGKKAMLPQDLVHDNLVDAAHFRSVAPDTIMLYFGQDY